MEMLKKIYERSSKYVITLFKWIFIAGVTGILGGAVGAMFHHSVEYVTELRCANEWMVYLLPVGGLLIVFLYHILGLKYEIGTSDILNAVRRREKGIPPVLAPAIFVTTVITHMLGGSAGREGAALQIGGGISALIGRIFRVGEKEFPLVLMCGMAALFSALFMTPLTATFFAMEVISVGIIHYSALVPCLCAALVGYEMAAMFGSAPIEYSINVPMMDVGIVVRVVILAMLCALLSIIFCTFMHRTNRFAKMYARNPYLRIFAGGTAVIMLTLMCGCYDYNGAGMDIVSNAINGIAKPEAFAWKMLFTAVTLASGFKGGEIVPTFFIGATFGCTVGGLLGLDPGFCAALGLVALFCGVVNSPIASIFLALELFGANGILFFAVACAVSYLLSGYYGLYSGQKIVYSKLNAEFIDIYAK